MASFSDSRLPNLKISLGHDEDNDLILDETMEDAPMERAEIKVKASSPVEEISIFEVNEEPEPEPEKPAIRTVPRRRTASDEDIKNLHKTFGLGESTRSVRLNAIHVRGVNDMSTDDIVDYFDGRGFADIEWINDYSCNVVWNDSNSAAVAMLAVSKPIARQEERKTPSESKDQPLLPPSSPVVVIYSDHDEPMSDDDDDDSKTKDDPMGSQPDQNVTLDVKQASSRSVSTASEDSIDVRSLGVPVPPGPWRLGNAHQKAKALLMRFATRADRKLPGAEKRSDYYLKYGNPNYGGMKGIISTSRKRKLLPGRNREPYRDLDGGHEEEAVRIFPDSPASGSDESPEQEFRRPKKLRMRMYADDEAERKVQKTLQRSSVDYESSSRRWSKVSSPSEIGDLRSRLTSNKRHSTTSSSRDARHRLNSSSQKHRSSSGERPSRRRWREDDDDDDEPSSGDDLRVRRRLQEEDERSSDDERSRHRWNKGKDGQNSSDDLRDKLDQLRKNKKFKQRSPLVIQVLSSTND